MSFFEPIIPRLPNLASNIAPQLLPTIYSGSTHSIKPNQLYQNDYDHSNLARQNQVPNNVPINNAPINNQTINNPNFLAANVANNGNDNKQEPSQNNHYYTPGKPTNGINYFSSIPENTKLLNQVLPFTLNNEGGNSNGSNFGYYSPLLDYQNQNIHMPINNTNVPFYSPLPDYISQKTSNSNVSFSSPSNAPKVSHPLSHQQLPTTPLNPQKNTVLGSIDSILKRESQHTSIPYRNNFDYLAPSLFDNNYSKNGNNTNTNISQTLISSTVGDVIEDIVKARAQNNKPFPSAIGSEIKQKKMSKATSLDSKIKEDIDKNKTYFDDFNSLINKKSKNEKPIQQNMIASAFSKSMLDSKNITDYISYNAINDNGALHQNSYNSNFLAANLLDNFIEIKEVNGMSEMKENEVLNSTGMRKLTKNAKVKKGKNDKKLAMKGKKKNYFNKTLESKKINEPIESNQDMFFQSKVGKENASPKNKIINKTRSNNIKTGITSPHLTSKSNVKNVLTNVSQVQLNMRKALTDRNDKLAWQYYKEIVESGNYKCLTRTDFSRILRILRNERGPVKSPNNLNEMVQIIEYIKEVGYQPNHGDFTTMIAAFGRSHQLVKALTYFEEMKQANLEPDIFTYNTLIDVYGKNKELSSAVKIFNEMKEKKLKPTLATYNILISAHGLNEDPKGAKHWFDQVINDSTLSANEITYSNIMDAYARVGDVDNTIKYLNEMLTKKITPSLGHYNSLVLVYTKVGNIEKATEMLKEMKSKGMEPSPHIYSLLMNAYGENDDITGAFDILNNHHKKPGRSMYHTMIQLYGKRGNLIESWKTLSQMIQQYITPTPLTWRILASCHGDNPCINYWAKQVNITPTAAMYNHFLEYYSKQPNIKAVDMLFQEMIAQNFTPTIETYNSILHAHSILGDSESVFKIYSELEKAKLEPNLYTYNIILKVYAKIGDSESAMKLFENEIIPKEKYGVIPDAFTYNALLESFKENFDNSAFKYLDDMKAKGLAPVPHRDTAIMKAIHASNNLN
ncbi:protein prenylyltransferase [Piromyces finnis]|uniref:Protein prenylyltransferase n=1 Tax=Piromyces finnis TaxID=1754191 RepID=A0A1Y1VLX5_9FUNG|nr:protein prenylyltransferase [Piromyces finnis]|eukprot:ORX59918.1 protein prenylyltransferase [Piromyces finnis]